MIALATGLYSILRGATTNAWGDDADASTVVATGVPLALQPVSRGRTSRASGGLREVDTYAGRAPYGTDIRLDDRVRNEATLEVFVLAVVSQPTNIIMQPDIRIEARRVSSGT